jgi:uncharacterized protein YjiS (DUF1127 family)
MAFDQVRGGRVDGGKERTRVAADLRQAVAIINVSRADLPAYPFGQWFRLLVLRRYANAMLKRVLRRPKRMNLDELSPHLLRDIGLPPDARS